MSTHSFSPPLPLLARALSHASPPCRPTPRPPAPASRLTQLGAYTVMREGNTNGVHPQDETIKAGFDGKIYAGIMPVYSFSNGHAYVVSQLHKASPPPLPPPHSAWRRRCVGRGQCAACAACLPPLTQALLPPTPTPLPLQKWGVEPYVIHFTWTRGGLDSKRWRIREARLWHDPPEYYSSPNILSVRLNVPKVRVRAGVGGCVRVGWGA